MTYQAVEAERLARYAERSSRIQSQARDAVQALDQVYRQPAEQIGGEVQGMTASEAARELERLTAVQPIFKGFFVLDGTGERIYPHGPARKTNPWPDPCWGMIGGVAGALQPPDPDRLLKLAQTQKEPEQTHFLLEKAAQRGPVEARITALFELARFHAGRDFSPASLVMAREAYQSLAEYPIHLLDMRGRPAPAEARLWLAKPNLEDASDEERALRKQAGARRARAILAELEASAYALPAVDLADLSERCGLLLGPDDANIKSRFRGVIANRQRVESYYARLDDQFLLRTALRRGGSEEPTFVSAGFGKRHEVLSYTLLLGDDGACIGLVALELDHEVLERTFNERLEALPGGKVVRGAAEDAPTDTFRVPLDTPFDDLTAQFSSAPPSAVVGELGLPRETVQLWMIVLLLVGIAAGAIVTLRTVHREAKATQLKSDFVSNVTHELKTPLTSIQMFLDTLILGRVESDEEAKECLEIMSRESQRLTRLIEQLLVFSRIENKKWRVRFTFAEAPKLVEEAIAVLAEHLHKTPEELAIEVSTMQETPKIPVDRFAIKEALLNLLHNAIKYSPNPDRKVRVVLASRRRYVEIAVEDNGMGVPFRDRRRIFVKFERGRNAEKGRIEGTGIGLTLADSIVKAHGGKITYTALKPRGSRFSVFLPK